MKIRTNYKLPLTACVLLLATSQLSLVQAEPYPYSNQGAQPGYDPGYQNYPGARITLSRAMAHPVMLPRVMHSPTMAGAVMTVDLTSVPGVVMVRASVAPGAMTEVIACPGVVDAVAAACPGAVDAVVTACPGTVGAVAGWIKTDLQMAGMTC